MRGQKRDRTAEVQYLSLIAWHADTSILLAGLFQCNQHHGRFAGHCFHN